MLKVLYAHIQLELSYIKRAEGVALLEELSAEQLIASSFVIIEQRFPDVYQLRIKDNYNLQEIGVVLNRRVRKLFNYCVTLKQ